MLDQSGKCWISLDMNCTALDTKCHRPYGALYFLSILFLKLGLVFYSILSRVQDARELCGNGPGVGIP